MPKQTFRELANTRKPLILPGAHDALTARLIGAAGFEAYMIGGFSLIGARYGQPDIGLVGLGEISSGVRDIMNVLDLPVLVDLDNGYGDVKNVVNTVHTYERMGVQAMFIEDQVWPKRCGHMEGKAIVPSEEMEAKIRAATGERINPDTFIIARTDARATDSLDEALRRGERYLAAGADSIFIESPMTIEEMEKVVRAFDVPQMANMLEGGKTPILTPSELGEIGFRMACYGINMLLIGAKVMRDVLADIMNGEMKMSGTGLSFKEYTDLVQIGEWGAIENQYRS